MTKWMMENFAFPRLQVTNKMICGLGQLPITLTKMVVHGQGDERYARYFNDTIRNHGFSKGCSF
jgi:hypothetical protein